MARECFCGCGRRLGFNDRSISRKAAKVDEEAAFLEQYVLPAQRESSQPSYELEGFIDDGRTMRDQLAAVIHREADARTVDRRGLAEWHGRAKTIINEFKVAAYKASRG
jgi:hypothetical protein